MRRFVEGVDRGQTTLFPECLEDWIDEGNPVRAIDAFVEKLDLSGLGFDGVAPEATGRPSYHPSGLLKLYIYGYLNRVQSSRRLDGDPRIALVPPLRRHLLPEKRRRCERRKFGQIPRDSSQHDGLDHLSLTWDADVVPHKRGKDFLGLAFDDENDARMRREPKTRQVGVERPRPVTDPLSFSVKQIVAFCERCNRPPRRQILVAEEQDLRSDAVIESDKRIPRKIVPGSVWCPPHEI